MKLLELPGMTALPKSGCMTVISLWIEISHAKETGKWSHVSLRKLLMKALSLSRTRPREVAELVTLIFSIRNVDFDSFFIETIEPSL